MKALEVGANYYGIFADQDKAPENKMIYNGGISWTAIKDGKSMTMDSQSTTDNAIAYINNSHKIGNL